MTVYEGDTGAEGSPRHPSVRPLTGGMRQMTTGAVGNGAVPLRSTSFEKFAGFCAILSGTTGFRINPALYTWLGGEQA